MGVTKESSLSSWFTHSTTWLAGVSKFLLLLLLLYMERTFQSVYVYERHLWKSGFKNADRVW